MNIEKRKERIRELHDRIQTCLIFSRKLKGNNSAEKTLLSWAKDAAKGIRVHTAKVKKG